MRFKGFVGPSYTLRSVNIDCQRCVNLYPETDEVGTGKDGEVAALVSTPGLSLLLTLAGGVCRGLYTATNGTLYAVGGNKLYSISSAWAETELGTLSTSTGKVSMADDGYNLIVVDGTYGYDWNFAGATFTTITDVNFHGADIVSFMDGYFIFNWPGQQGYFYCSSLPSTDATTGLPVSSTSNIAFDNNPAQVANAEGSADALVSHIVVKENLWLLGDQTTEVWYDAGSSPGIPFARIQGALIEYGCAAKFSVAKIASTLFWLGKDQNGQGIVVMADGYSPQRISTHAVEFAIQGYSTISDAIAFSYQDQGHDFYVLNFPTGNATWVYDVRTGMWHERAYTNNGALDRHRANCHALAYGVHVVGDWENGKIYKFSNTVYSDNGTAITRLRSSPHLTQDMLRICYSKFQLDFEPGVGIDGSGQGTDPQAMLQFSDDGGHTWSNEKWTSLGAIGQTKWRAIWRRLGQARDRVFRLKITDPVKVVITGAEIDAEMEAS